MSDLESLKSTPKKVLKFYIVEIIMSLVVYFSLFFKFFIDFLCFVVFKKEKNYKCMDRDLPPQSL